MEELKLKLAKLLYREKAQMDAWDDEQEHVRAYYTGLVSRLMNAIGNAGYEVKPKPVRAPRKSAEEGNDPSVKRESSRWTRKDTVEEEKDDG